jgi:hypothetical protein
MIICPGQLYATTVRAIDDRDPQMYLERDFLVIDNKDKDDEDKKKEEEEDSESEKEAQKMR